MGDRSGVRTRGTGSRVIEKEGAVPFARTHGAVLSESGPNRNCFRSPPAPAAGVADLFVVGRSLPRIVSQSALLVGFGAGGVLLAVAVLVVTGLAEVRRTGVRGEPETTEARDGDVHHMTGR